MPVTTRSKSRDLRAIQDAPLASPPSETIKGSSDTPSPTDTKKNRARSQGSRKAKRSLFTSQKLRKRKLRGPRPRNQETPKNSRKQLEAQEEENSQTLITLSSPRLSEIALTHFACRVLSCCCPQGAFEYRVDSCVRCGHNMDDHSNYQHPWAPGCD